jgi:hypothetical protein
MEAHIVSTFLRNEIQKGERTHPRSHGKDRT